MKAKKSEKSLVVGLDVGTSKIVAIVGECQPDGAVEVIGLGSHPSTGLRRGVVVDMASTEQAIQRAVEEAELMAGCEISSVYAGIAGGHIRAFNSHGVVAVKDREVREGDVKRVFLRRVGKVPGENFGDQFTHVAAAVAVGERDVLVFHSCYSNVLHL